MITILRPSDRFVGEYLMSQAMPSARWLDANTTLLDRTEFLVEAVEHIVGIGEEDFQAACQVQLPPSGPLLFPRRIASSAPR
jgi:hypothetical protein